ncbi:outer membrane protein assembly factor BamB family protein [Halorarum salinum]|uniref:PQQ-binding-like beta-propeller repeat protein n=1 Tax=Halorarum salinum TaxID=2743089 RepID=A0A7D5Q9U5_9EURY|nr:PQQ-binding-like beta-propeller repeat protein [Halobaculum salinum]QLG60340.1 PQQ-binding-like beta-propeller repeat protein [Halobaculum salinum]
MNASPVVGDGIVYVPGSGDPGLIHAIDIETGDQVWQFEPEGYASSSPALVDGTLYVGTWGKRFYAIDADSGEEAWSREIGHRFGSSSPVIADGTVYVGTNGDGPLIVSGPDDEEEFEACKFLALDADTGETQWEYREFGEKENVDSSPAIADGRVYFLGETAVYAVDAETGDEVWTRSISTHSGSSPAVVDGVVYYGAPTDGESEIPAQVWALDASSGETLWTAGIDDVSLRTSPAVADGTVYVAASSMRVCYGGGGDGEPECSGVTRGQLYALDAATGERRWTAEIKTDTRSSPAVADGVIYVGCRDGVSAVTTAGENAWRVAFESDREDGPYVKSSPAVIGGYVFIGASDGRLRAISATESS